MKISGGILLASVSALAVAGVSTQVRAADIPVKAPVEEVGIEFHGAAEWGWNYFVNRPPLAAAPCTVTSVPNPARVNPGGVNDTGIFCNGGRDGGRDTRAKFEEYGSIPAGPTFDFATVSLATKNGLYFAEAWAQNIGRNNQSYLLDVGKAGVAYLTLGFDQTPHLYSTSAVTIWGGVGSTTLTTPFNFGISPASNFATQNAINNAILAGAGITSIGIQRSTASAAYRATPTPETDFRVEYSGTRREGTQLTWGIIQQSFGSPALQMPKPVADTTQNIAASGEYYGTTFWGGKYNVKAGYNASVYQDDFSMFTFQNPFGNGTAANPSFGFLSLPPNNNAQAFTLTSGVDLPFRSRYMATISYNTMRQNDAFGPETVNPACCGPGGPPVLPGTLNGEINTLLVNNVLNSQLTDDLKSTFKFRYYDFDNRTPAIIVPTYVLADVQLKTAPDVPRRSLQISYIKENASEDLTWRATNWLTLGAVGGWERWDRDHMDANVTTEWQGKFYANAKTWDIGTLRTSVEFDARRYDTYDYLDYVARVAYLNAGESVNSSLMRMFDMANRDRIKGNLLWQIDFPGGFSITPNAGVRLDNYQLDPTIGTFGVQQDNMWNAGADLAYTFTRGITFLMSYNREEHREGLFGAQGQTIIGTGVTTTNNSYNAQMNDFVDVFTVGANFELVPGRDDFKFTYTYVHDREVWNTGIVTALAGQPSNFSQYPDVVNNFQRIDAIYKHRFDPDWVRKAGFTGDVVAKIRYTWERNSVANWQDVNTPDVWFYDQGANRMLSMAATNPNYNIQMVVASLAVKW
jgi:MtrB/PioB family decaheme-associated outer membrane protein